jgi:hypothetical protein
MSMTLRSYIENLISRIPLEIDPHEGEPNYFDFVTYFGLVSLSMGTITDLSPSAKDDAAPGEHGCSGEQPSS